MQEDHMRLLQRCEELGLKASESGNNPAGSLIAMDGHIISEAFEATKTKMDITCHAEIEALRMAATVLHTNDLSDCVLYTNFEPCVMCSYAIRYHRISKVVYQHPVPFFGGITSRLSLLITTDVPPHWAPPPVILHIATI